MDASWNAHLIFKTSYEISSKSGSLHYYSKFTLIKISTNSGNSEKNGKIHNNLAEETKFDLRLLSREILEKNDFFGNWCEGLGNIANIGNVV